MGSVKMEWSATSATKAYLDTIKLCKYDTNQKKRRDDTTKTETQEPGSSEFVSALAAGMRAKLIVEVTSAASPSTIALAAAARHTGGRLVCILPEADVLAESKRVIRDSGLKDLVEFETGDAAKLLPRHPNVDFSLVNCARDEAGYARLLGSIDVNPRRSVVVARDYFSGGERNNNKLGLGVLGFALGQFKRVLDKKKLVVRSVKQYPIGKGIEIITMIEKRDNNNNNNNNNNSSSSSSSSLGVRKDIDRSLGSGFVKRTSSGKKSKWVANFDEESGEEHIFRVPI